MSELDGIRYVADCAMSTEQYSLEKVPDPFCGKSQPLAALLRACGIVAACLWITWSMVDMRLPLASEGTREMLIAAALCLVWAGLWSALGPWPVAVLGVLVLMAVLLFFRDPDRAIPLGRGLILSAADGRVTHVQRIEHEPTIGGPAVRVSVFLSVADVHVNRAPCAARVIDAQLREGLFLDARDESCAGKNACNTLTLSPEGPITGPILVKQLVGKIARRIVCNVRPGDCLATGQKFGMIKFGSRTDVIVPEQPGLEVRVKVGQKVHGGTSILARIVPPETAGRVEELAYAAI
jgi:phosphatidylserine decarboxylase